jgi:bifunctional non-homologous end joining protein LigD
MLATARPLPSKAGAKGMGFEFKWDGARCSARRHPDGRVRLDSRNDKAFTATFTEVADAVSDVLPGRSVALDGEVVAYAPGSGVPDFARLQRRLGLTATSTLMAAVPVHYLVFDVVAIDGHSIAELPLWRRRELLEDLELSHPGLSVPPNYLDVDPAVLFDISDQHQLEGVVGKRLDSPYRPGRSPDWIKHAIRKRIEVVLGGWIPSSDGQGSGLGSLLVGRPNVARAPGSPVRIEFVGGVGTGWSHALGRRILDQLLALERDTSPFKDPVPRDYARFARWVAPELIADVDYRNWTGTGMLRHPSFKGLREDRDLAEIARQT